jgi:hypothetical protein
MISATTTSTTSNNTLSGITFHRLLNVPTKLSNVDSLTRASHEQQTELMSDGYIPSDSDICCGRGKQNWNMTGNLHFRKLIRTSVARYTAAPSKKEKSAVILSVVDEIRGQGGHFLKQRHQQQQNGSSNCCWYDIGAAAAREKVSHSLRDLMNSARNDSAPKSLLRQAKEEQTKRCAADASTSDCDSVESGTASCSSWWI